MADERLFKFSNIDFGSFKKNYSSFLKDYTASLGDMMALNTQFLKDKSEEIDKLMQINNVIFSSSRGEDQEAAPRADGDPVKNQVNEYMRLSSQTSEQVDEQFKNADAMLRKATEQLEALSSKSNEMMKKMHPGMQAAPPPDPPGPPVESPPEQS